MLYEYQPGRGAKHPKAFLTGYKGYLHTDGYAVYHGLPEGITVVDCHAMSKELADPADIARCHAVGQACSVVHTEGHAMGYPIYELTALVRELGLENCRTAVEARVRDYEQRLRLWTEREQTDCRDWADFLRE